MNDQERAGSIARDILALARNSLVVNFRFLDRAVSRLEFIADENVSLATDGESIYYSPWYILRIYKNEQTAVTRDLFHSILHCVFRHNFIGRDIDRLRCGVPAQSGTARRPPRGRSASSARTRAS